MVEEFLVSEMCSARSGVCHAIFLAFDVVDGHLDVEVSLEYVYLT